MAEAFGAAGLWPMKEYIRRRQDTIEEYIMNHPIHELCTGGGADARIEQVPAVVGSGSYPGGGGQRRQ